MIKSMTGFGRGECGDQKCKFVVEMKAVNHRYCEINVRLPKKFAFHEFAMRDLIKKYASRGKIDVFVTYEEYSDEHVNVTYNSAMAKAYSEYVKQISEDFGIAYDLTAAKLSRYPEVFTLEEEEIDEDTTWKLLSGALKIACEKFVKAREDEGANLKNDLIEKLDHIKALVEEIKVQEPRILKEYQDKLTTKIRAVLEDNAIDEGRILTEVAIMADKICVDEEMVRLISHIDMMKNTLEHGDGIGRKLDFIAQEMNREANTTLSKSDDIGIVNIGIELKTGIEKVREQIQNIE